MARNGRWVNIIQLEHQALYRTAWARWTASGSIRIGFVTAPTFVAIVWHTAFKTNDVAGRGLFAVVAIE